MILSVRTAHSLLLVLALMLAGCAAWVQPQTPDETAAYLEGGLTAAYQSIAEMRKSGRITADQRDALVADADIVGAALDAYGAIRKTGDLSTATAKLRLARDALTALQATLRSVK